MGAWVKSTGIVFVLFAVMAIAQPTTETTFPILQKQFNSQKDPVIRSRLALALGVMAYRMNQLPQAIDYLNASIKDNGRLSDYAYLHLGMIQSFQGNLPDAIKSFEKVITFKPKSVLALDAEMELSKIAIKQENWKVAVQRLKKLEHSARGDEDYPEILFELMKSYFKEQNRGEACRVAQKLFVRYPMYTVAKSWGPDLSKIKVGEDVFLCSITNKDREKRIERFLLEGELQQAKDEVTSLFNELRKDDKPHAEEVAHLEWINARIAWAEGRLNDVITSVQKIHDLKGRVFESQMMLAKSYAQMDEYGKAVMAYRGASQIAKSQKQSNSALFQAAFLSYRNRDYDGASRAFEGLVNRARGQIAWDSRWHLAWIRYLKADYDGAIKEFNELLNSRYSATRINKDKIYYWRAMAEFKRGHPEAARLELEHLARQSYLSYYAGAAMARLTLFPGNQKVVLGNPNGNGQSVPINGSELPRDPAAVATEDKEAKEETAPEDEGMRLEAEGTAAEEAPESLPVTQVKDPKLAELFDRAHDLIELGFDSWAKRELRNIEKRTRNKAYLQNLMADYAKVGDFYRSAYIADVNFGDQRESGGVESESQLWMMAFPRAYSKYTAAASKKFEVPQALIWSVMRGESSFRENVHSPAGAMGLMQLIPPTARRLAKDLGYNDFASNMLLSPEVNIQFGTRYLRRLSKLMNNQLPQVLGSYNAGPHRMQGWLMDFGNLDMDEFIEHIPYIETRNYIKKVLRNYMVYQVLYEKKNNPLSFLIQKPEFKRGMTKPTAESWDDLASM